MSTVQVGTNPSRWMVSAPLSENAGKYLTGNIYEGRLPDRFCSSQKLSILNIIGEVVHRHGHAFAEKVAERLQKK